MLEWHCTYGVTDVERYADGSITARVNCSARELWVAYFPRGNRNTNWLLRGDNDEVSHFKSRAEAEECLLTCGFGPLVEPVAQTQTCPQVQPVAATETHCCG